MHASLDQARTDLLEDLDAFIWEADPATFQFTYVSRGAEELLGYSLDDWLARPTFWVDLLHADDREAAIAHCTQAVAECADHDFEYRVRAADGRVLWVRDIVKVICDTERRPTLLRGLMVDITNQRATLSTLDRQDRYYQALIEQVLDIVTVLEPNGIVRYESPSAERLLGYPQCDRIGRDVFEPVHPDDVERVRAVFDFGRVTGMQTPLTQFRYRHADGTWRVLEAIGRAFAEEDNRLVGIVSSRDVTERRSLEEQLRHAQKMDALGRLTTILAHEFNNVLQAILGNLDIALQSEYAIGMRLQLTEARNAADLGVTIARQLLTFSHRSPNDTRRIDVHAAITQVDGILRRVVGVNVQLDVSLWASNPCIRLGTGMLEQILLNLAANARDAMPQGGVLRIRTRDTSDPTADPQPSGGAYKSFVAIVVSDNGVGMSSTVRARIFEPFFTTKEIGKGTGLGLSTVYSIVSDNGGQIHVSSEPKLGTAFHIYFPIDAAETGAP